jgi:hypothetical protein
MADKTTLEQMLEHLVNDDQAKAEELFHEYVVAKSREIYEGLIESEVDEASDDEEKDDDVEESFEVIEADDDEEGSDPTDDMMSDLEGDDDMDDMGDDEGSDDEPATKQDVTDAFDELMAKFDELAAEVGGDDMGDEMDDMGDEMGPQDDEMKDAFEPQMATVREYVEKVPAGHGAEKKGAGEAAGASAKSPVAGKNDMGGTTANMVKGGTGSEAGTAGGLASNKPQQMSTGNINVPGGKAGGAFAKKEPGHGAEKKGAGEQGGTNANSLFRNK